MIKGECENMMKVRSYPSLFFLFTPGFIEFSHFISILVIRYIFKISLENGGTIIGG